MGRRPKPPATPNPIGDAIRAACRWKGWSQADLAAAMFVSRQRISNICHGRETPSIEWLARCARALQIDPAEFGLPARPVTGPPEAVLELFVVQDGLGMPNLLGADDTRSAELLRALGFDRPIPIDGPQLRELVRRAADAKIALTIRTDLDAFPS